jgi:hypothetical protein
MYTNVYGLWPLKYLLTLHLLVIIILRSPEKKEQNIMLQTLADAHMSLRLYRTLWAQKGSFHLTL